MGICSSRPDAGGYAKVPSIVPAPGFVIPPAYSPSPPSTLDKAKATLVTFSALDFDERIEIGTHCQLTSQALDLARQINGYLIVLGLLPSGKLLSERYVKVLADEVADGRAELSDETMQRLYSY